jgi:uncharacterized repeat protein (TIGR04052 family)
MLLPYTFAALLLTGAGARAADQKVAIRFRAQVGNQKLACGNTYAGIGITASTISPRDFRFYIHDVMLIDPSGKSVPVELDQDGKWQLDDVALLDFEDGTAGCVNGTPDMNDQVTGVVPAGHYTGLSFTLGVPFNKNHTDLTSQPPPLNLTALAWVWNAGRKFARLDFSSTGLPRGFAIHLGSTGCTPNDTKITVPTQCSQPNRPHVLLPEFDFRTDAVIADLAALLKDSNVDKNQENTASGCMSGPDDADCAPLFANLGLPFGGKVPGKQSFFRRGSSTEPAAASRSGR